MMMEQEQETKNQQGTVGIISSMTLTMYDDLRCDIEPVSVVEGKEYPFNPNTLESFKGFLDSLCQKFNIAEVLKDYIESSGDGKNTE